MDFINACDRLPAFHRRYFVKINGRKDVVPWHELEHLRYKYEEVLWLEEDCDKFEPAKQIGGYEFKRDKIDEEVVHTPVPVMARPLSPEELGKVETVIIPKVVVSEPEIDHLPAARSVDEETRKSFVDRAVQRKHVDSAPLVVKEYGLNPGVSSYANPKCPLKANDPCAKLKFNLRASMISFMADSRDLKKVSKTWEFYKVLTMKRLYPEFRQPDIQVIPQYLVKEIIWVFGVSSVAIINDRLWHTNYTKTTLQKQTTK